MKPLQLPATASAVLSFDFDGTLHDPSAQPPVWADFFVLIQQLRTEKNAIWGINTGRSMPQVIDGFIESRFPFLPDFVVAREREIYFPNPLGRYLPHTEWNKKCEKEIRRLFKKSRKLLDSIRKDIEEHTGAQWVETSGDPAGLISRTDEEMDWIEQRIRNLAAENPKLSWQRNSIYLRFGHLDFQKGSSLTEVASNFKIAAPQCFAIGDSHNDLAMLDSTHAGMIACPGNSVEAIKTKVLASGGFLAKADHSAGAIEALRHYFHV
ncbi:HAD family phosphatase [Luteolibacter pohnpeiensis]|uniref:HAD family phosphatase n=1 Tax=Luteolibacter pohnpeiensis TaxID=454153 RepID=A0A934VVT7_9BACT|nr:HAD hydrolase family protein [Luteolibacter pohnpeiensis]MBK1881839.1 HAD family phosphatase [Luteolibacter pohnpeiensis]